MRVAGTVFFMLQFTLTCLPYWGVFSHSHPFAAAPCTPRVLAQLNNLAVMRSGSRYAWTSPLPPPPPIPLPHSPHTPCPQCHSLFRDYFTVTVPHSVMEQQNSYTQARLPLYPLQPPAPPSPRPGSALLQQDDLASCIRSPSLDGLLALARLQPLYCDYPDALRFIIINILAGQLSSV